MIDIIRELEKDEDRALNGTVANGLRERSVARIAARLADAARDLAAAKTDEDRQRLVAYEKRSVRPTEAAAVASKLVALRRQVTWNKAVEAAHLACLLLSEAMGGEPVASDEAGISVGNDDRRMVSWLVGEGRRVRAGSGGKPGFLKA